jgi:Polyketide cyclase / dehydrase and lipid transport
MYDRSWRVEELRDQEKDWPAIFKAGGLGTVVGVFVGLAGFFFARAGSQGMGLVMFFLVPVAAGFTVALLTNKPNTATAAGLLAVLVTLIFLIAFGFEGILCALMASPFLLTGIAIGALLGRIFRPNPRNDKTLTTGMLLLLPITVVFTGQQVEKPLLRNARIEVVSSTVRVGGTPEHMWLYIQSIDSIHGSKPWLMHVGLPVPQRCTLEKTAEGARRTCYFDKGYIEETVTQWDPPHYMELRIDRTHMPGRHWLGFETASYRLQADGNSTLLTRTTTIASHLAPAWYWGPLERWGVQSEHEYLLNDVVNQFSQVYPDRREGNPIGTNRFQGECLPTYGCKK